MELQTKVIKRIIRVKFPDREHIDRSKLASMMGVSRSAVTQWLNTGIVDERHIPKLERISLIDVWTERKPYAKPRKKGGSNGENHREEGRKEISNAGNAGNACKEGMQIV